MSININLTTMRDCLYSLTISLCSCVPDDDFEYCIIDKYDFDQQDSIWYILWLISLIHIITSQVIGKPAKDRHCRSPTE